MGRIKTDMVKRTTRKIIAAYGDEFSDKFDKNKLALNARAEVRSKKLRNVIAGYAVRLKQQQSETTTRLQRRPSKERDSYEPRERRERRN